MLKEGPRLTGKPNTGVAFFCKDYIKSLAGGADATPLAIAGASMMSGVFCVTTCSIPGSGVPRGRLTHSPAPKIASKPVSASLQLPDTLVHGSQFFTYDLLKKKYSTYGLKARRRKTPHEPLVAVPCGAAASVVSTTFGFP